MSRRCRVWLWLLAAVASSLLVVRIVADPVARHYTRRTLRQLPGIDGAISDVHVEFLRLSFAITDIKLFRRDADRCEPAFYARRVTWTLPWRNLVHLRLGATMRIEDAKAVILTTDATTNELPSERENRPLDLDVIDAQLQRLVPGRVVSIDVRRSEAIFITHHGTMPVRVRLGDVEAMLENVSTRRKLTRGEPATCSVHATLQHSGELSLFLTANVVAETLDFSGRVEIHHLRLADVHELIGPLTGPVVARQTFDEATAFAVKHERVSGTIEPRSSDDPVASPMPLHKTIHGRGTDVYAALEDILPDAFVEGLSGVLSQKQGKTSPAGGKALASRPSAPYRGPARHTTSGAAAR